MARAEIKALKMLKGSQNVLQLKEVLETRNSMYIITELCEKGTLREALAQQRKFPEARAIKILQEIVQGYRAISQNKLIHRDIKPDNIFLGAEDAVRIGDFGFAIDAAECVAPCGENVGSPLYMSYEALTSNVYSFKSDLWAIGLTFLEMLTGKTPWKSKTEN
jgi:serine/threonine protein kinase